MTKEEFSKQMDKLCEFYEKPLSDMQTKVWFNIFCDVSEQQFSEAITEHLKIDDNPNFPAIGKIYKKIKPENYIP